MTLESKLEDKIKKLEAMLKEARSRGDLQTSAQLVVMLTKARKELRTQRRNK